MKQPQTILLSDYQAPTFQVDKLDLTFELNADATLVTATSQLYRQEQGPLLLNGENLELLAVSVDGKELVDTEYIHTDGLLKIEEVPDRFELKVLTQINPAANTALEGLYQSSGNFCTQCEAEGFRKITFYFDRPDVLTVFSTKIIADKTLYPVLLSNGNLQQQGELADNKHFALWHDPHPKPCYLFALVAGDLALVQDQFTTVSGRSVDLRIYTEVHNIDKCSHAMQSLKHSMQWDEQRFGLEYDLDIYMIVAVDDFNMGAMENKGLNVFNSKFVLAKPDTATDVDYQNIEGVIGHEYFHNWTGNRITCRDWFQLSLKEGLTVFRDQEFSSDMGSRAIKRIEDVRLLRTHQFAEDAGPMAHPIRPDSYIEINNFYTLTVYEKGSEVIRMLHTLLGEEGFQRGMRLYIERHDGQAVTCDDFVAAMSDANAVDLTQFKHWYTQAGTPVLQVTESYAADSLEYRLDFTQHTPDTPGQSAKQPLHIPVLIGLVGADGCDLEIENTLLNITQPQQSFVFKGIDQRPTPSLLRGFSAPVKLEFDYSQEQLLFLAANDNDSFNRWEAMQNLALALIHGLIVDFQAGRELSLDIAFIQACEDILQDRAQDKSLLAAALTLPSERYIAETMTVVDPDAIHAVREFMMGEMAQGLHKSWLEVYHENNTQEHYAPVPEDIAERSLKNTCLAYLMHLDNNESFELCLSQCQDANNMTDSLSALALLCDYPGEARKDVLHSFYQRWQDDVQVMDKWFAVQGGAALPNALESVQALMQHEKFSMHNPNRLRALLGAFCMNNAVSFHHIEGGGYRLLADVVIQLNTINPQVASRMVSAFNSWRRYDEHRQHLIQVQLQRIAEQPDLSRDVYEIVSKALSN